MSASVRQVWGEPGGIPSGSDFSLEAVLTVNGAISESQVTSSGTFTLSIENTVQPVLPLLDGEASDSVSKPLGLVKWNITSAQSSGWPAGTFNGDIRLEDSGGSVTYWPVSLRMRSVIE